MKRYLLLSLLLGLLVLVLAACGGAPAAPAVDTPKVDLASLPVNIDVKQAGSLLNNPEVVFIDVREQDEYDAGHIPGVKLIPLGTVASRMSEIPKDKTVVVACRSGNRSGQATEFLRQQGFTNVHNMTGGMNDWAQAGLPVEK